MPKEMSEEGGDWRARPASAPAQDRPKHIFARSGEPSADEVPPSLPVDPRGRRRHKCHRALFGHMARASPKRAHGTADSLPELRRDAPRAETYDRRWHRNASRAACGWCPSGGSGAGR